MRPNLVTCLLAAIVTSALLSASARSLAQPAASTEGGAVKSGLDRVMKGLNAKFRELRNVKPRKKRLRTAVSFLKTAQKELEALVARYPKAKATDNARMALKEVKQVRGRLEVESGLKKFPPFKVTRWITPKRVDTSKLKGKPFVVEFWSTTCPPCRESIPHLNKISRKYGPKGLKIIGLTSDPVAEVKEIEAFAKEMKVAYCLGFDRELAGKLGVTGIPQAIVVDGKGTVVWWGHPMDPAFGKAIEEVMRAK